MTHLPRPGLLLVIAYIGFVSLGLPDPLVGVAWPTARDEFGVWEGGLGLVFLAMGCGYCLSGFFGGTLTQRLGLGNLLWASSGLVAVAMLGSGLAPGWWAVVACGVIWGLGSGGIDAGLNAHAAAHFSPRHMNWLHACYSLGATLGPLVMTAAVVRAGSWRAGYEIVGGLLLGMTALFLLTRRQWGGRAEPRERPEQESASLRTALRDRTVWLQMLLFFLYVGAEFTAGQWAFTILTESRGMAKEPAGLAVAGYYGAIGVGRVLAGGLTSRIGLDRLVRLALLLTLVGGGLFAGGGPGPLAVVGLGLAGLGLAPVFPCLMAATPGRLGAGLATHAVGFQVSAGMFGAAVLPFAAGLMVAFGVETIAWLVVGLVGLLLAGHLCLPPVRPVQHPA